MMHVAQRPILSFSMTPASLRPLRRRPVAALAPWRLKKVLGFIEGNIDAPLRLGELAAVAGLSRMHFAAQFAEATGCGPHDYVLRRRIERAKVIIAASNMAMVNVALDSGFQSQAHFCTIFKRFTGVTPTNWSEGARSQRENGSGTVPMVWPQNQA